MTSRDRENENKSRKGLRSLSFRSTKSKKTKSSHGDIVNGRNGSIIKRYSVPELSTNNVFSASSVLCICVAILPFRGLLACDLSFQVGDRIDVLTQTDSSYDWWEGRVNGRTGIFPANYIKAVLCWLVVVYLVSPITVVRTGSLFRPRTPGKNDGPDASLNEASSKMLSPSGVIGRSLGASSRSGNAMKRSGGLSPCLQSETASASQCQSTIPAFAPCPYAFELKDKKDREPFTIMYATNMTDSDFCLYSNGKANYDGVCVFVYYDLPVQMRDENNHWRNYSEKIPVARVCVQPSCL